jgi:putative transposase
MLWAIDFQFDSTVDGKAIKLASMIDEHTRCSLLNIVERSITGEHFVEESTKVFAAAGGPPKVVRMDNGPKFIPQALQQFREGRSGCSTSRPEPRGTTRSTTTAASTWPSGTGHWRTLRRAGVPTPRSRARSTESGTKQPDSRSNAVNLGVVAAQCCLSLKYVVAVRVRLMKLG